MSGPWPANERVADAFNLLGFKQIDIQMLLVSGISPMSGKSLLDRTKDNTWAYVLSLTVHELFVSCRRCSTKHLLRLISKTRR